MSFAAKDVHRLSKTLTSLGIYAYVIKRNIIYIPSTSIYNLFEYIGHQSPVSCYTYKFDINTDIKGLISSKEASKRLQKSPGFVNSHIKKKHIQAIKRYGKYWVKPDDIHSLN